VVILALGIALSISAAQVRRTSAQPAPDPSCSLATPCIEYQNTSSGPGVEGVSKNGSGIEGISTNSTAVAGSSTTFDGVSGSSSDYIGVSGTSARYDGVYGTTTYNSTSATSASGVVGLDGSSAGTHNNGVKGVSGSGTGVLGTSTSGNGVTGTTSSTTGNSGVSGITTGNGNGVYGKSPTRYGVEGVSTSYYGVAGFSTSGGGVGGVSTSGNGVVGTTSSTTGNSGVAGITTGTANGVYGRSPSGDGVQGVSTSGNGVVGTTHHEGMSGVEGINNGSNSPNFGNGVYGNSALGNGVFGWGQIGVVGKCTIAYPIGDEFEGVSSSGKRNYFVNCNGDPGTVVSTRNNMYASATMPRSTLPVLEDYGQAQLINGSATVRLDKAFAETISDRSPYLVFLTPDGDTNGLYVASKSIQEFQVREIHGGRSSLVFDYRIVARPANDALPRMTLSAQPSMAPLDVTR
jgi:hypothetical protein